MGETKSMDALLLKMINYQKDITIFGIKPVIVLKKEFNYGPMYKKKFLKIKISSYGDEATNFHDKYTFFYQ